MWFTWSPWLFAIVLISVASAGGGLDIDLNSEVSIKKVAKQIAQDTVVYYTGGSPQQVASNVPGTLPEPYYWWEGGALMGAMIDYWYYTGDDHYNKLVTDGLLFQIGPGKDYMPPNQTLTEGNDDQGFWGMAVMSAAEHKFPDPPPDQPQWLALAQAVFNTQAARWDTQYCNGGLRWQIFTWNKGFNYKNSISQACFFNIAARLALYTGNSSYADWAMKTWDWMWKVRLIDERFYIYDGAFVEDGCSKRTPYQFSYNPGAFLHGAAAMYAYYSGARDTKESDYWKRQVNGLVDGLDVFFYQERDGSKVMYEVACEGVGLCDDDQMSFKAYLSRWMAATTKWAPWTFKTIKPLLKSSAKAAIATCRPACGLRWANNSGGANVGPTGVGQSMAAMEVVLANMIEEAGAPVTNSSGGTSQGDPSAGGSDIGRTRPEGSIHYKPITTADQAGAGMLTFVIIASLLTAVFYMGADEPVNAVKNLWAKRSVGINKKSPSSEKSKGSEENHSRAQERGPTTQNGSASMETSSVANYPARNPDHDT